MKKVLMFLVMAALLGGPLMAQDDEDEKGLKDLTRDELLQKLHAYMKKASEEMDELEIELAKASLDSPKADVVASRVKQIREEMAKGKPSELPEGLREYLRDNPEEAAELTGKTEAEIEKLAGDSTELEALLRKNPALLKKLAENDNTFEKILGHQHAAEKRLEATLKAQKEAQRLARENIDDSLDVGHELKSRSS